MGGHVTGGRHSMGQTVPLHSTWLPHWWQQSPWGQSSQSWGGHPPCNEQHYCPSTTQRKSWTVKSTLVI